MPLEHRVISFSGDETVLALTAFRRRNPTIPSTGRIIACEASSDGPIVTLEVRGIGETRRERARVSEDLIRDALVQFCIDARVLLPANVTKRLLCIRGHFLIEMHFDSEHLTVAESTGAPSRSGVAPAPREYLWTPV